MPLNYPATQQWPPPECDAPYAMYDEWDAWYAGDRGRLMAIYGSVMPTISVRASQSRTGLVGRLARFWWGQPLPQTQPVNKMHMPLAADLAMYSSDLLFSAPPDIDLGYGSLTAPSGDAASLTVVSTPDPRAQRWDKIVEYGSLWQRLLEAAETCAAVGGVYLKCAAAPALCKVPFVCSVPPENAVPDWRLGWLNAVTFHRVIHRNDDKQYVWRHLERYEVVAGNGVVYHAVYAGTTGRLGVVLAPEVAAAMFPDIGQLLISPGGALQPDGSVAYSTGTKGLAATYVPNVLPNRLLRGQPYGRSDYASSEGPMDALDEVWSSLMRDIRLGKGRIVVPAHMLQNNGKGNGARFEVEQEIFSAVAAVPNTEGQQLTVSQFEIRVDEHLAAARAIVEQVMRTAGYDPGALDDPSEAAKTATEVANAASRTLATRGRKIGYWTPALRWLVPILQQMDAAFFGQPGPAGDDPAIEFPDAVSTDPEKVARTLQLLDAAAAVSTATKVAMLHPEWGEEEIGAEVALIEESKGAAMPDPSQFDPAPEVDPAMPPGA